MAFVFQDGNVEDLLKRVEVLEGYHNNPTPKDVNIISENSNAILTENGIILKTE